MKTKKCILFSRVSTTQQDIIAQTNELYNEAARIGYSKCNTILIEQKESAISLDIENREGILDLKSAVEKDSSINCVITWELTRLARRTDVLFHMRDYFIANDINWVIMKPYMSLLNTDRTVNSTFSMMLAVFATFAENEMIIKKERFARTKEAKKLRGEFIGGGIVFGYMVKDKHIAIDENTAPLVRQIYDLCACGNSAYSIGKTLYECNVLPHSDLNSAVSFVGTVLRQKAYNSGKSKYSDTNVYPKLIDDETYRKAMEQVKKGTSGQKTNTKCIYYCRGILFDNISKRKMSPIANRGAYKFNRIDKENVSISINVVESLGWHIAKEYKMENASGDRRKNLMDTTAEYKKYTSMHAKCIKTIAEIDEKLKKVEMRYIDGKISLDTADEIESTLNKQRAELYDRAAKSEIEMGRLIKLLNSIKNSTNVDFNDYTDEQKRDAVLEVIKAMYVQKESYYRWHAFIEYTTGRNRHICIDSYNHAFYEDEFDDKKLLNVEYLKRFGHVAGTKSRYVYLERDSQ